MSCQVERNLDLPFDMGFWIWCLGLILGLSLKNLPFMWHVSSEWKLLSPPLGRH
jgi:hypothetical protein